MIHLDTSVVVALLTPEERSAQALDWCAQAREPFDVDSEAPGSLR